MFFVPAKPLATPDTSPVLQDRVRVPHATAHLSCQMPSGWGTRRTIRGLRQPHGWQGMREGDAARALPEGCTASSMGSVCGLNLPSPWPFMGRDTVHDISIELPCRPLRPWSRRNFMSSASPPTYGNRRRRFRPGSVRGEIACPTLRAFPDPSRNPWCCRARWIKPAATAAKRAEPRSIYSHRPRPSRQPILRRKSRGCP